MPSRERREAREQTTRRLRLAVAAAVVVLVAGGVIAAVLLFKGRGSSSQKSAPSLHFLVNSVDCGSENIVTAEGRIKAPEEFCIADLTVQSIGVPESAMDLTCQYLLTRSGSRLPANGEGTLLLNGTPAGTTRIDVGSQPQSLMVAFDAPHGTEPDALELHSSCTSRGVTIKGPS